MLSRPKIGATITAFRDDAALTQLTFWLKDMALDATKKEKQKADLEQIVSFINNSGLLPNNAILLDDIDSEGIKLKDPLGKDISLLEMSDGYRSVLSMTLDIIRFMMETYGSDKVFNSSSDGKIDLPGVVLIDEVDAHLHPSWQNDIGQWFTNYFPNIQFIVTTHSPIICRACEKGSIWKLPTPGTDEKAREIIGTERNKLIFGNILDQYATGDFGREAPRSKDTSGKLDRLAELNNKSAFGALTNEEKSELDGLRKVLTTDDTTDY
jgi:predicted ATP-dependent endonuclease of OLD family